MPNFLHSSFLLLISQETKPNFGRYHVATNDGVGDTQRAANPSRRKAHLEDYENYGAAIDDGLEATEPLSKEPATAFFDSRARNLTPPTQLDGTSQRKGRIANPAKLCPKNSLRASETITPNTTRNSNTDSPVQDLNEVAPTPAHQTFGTSKKGRAKAILPSVADEVGQFRGAKAKRKMGKKEKRKAKQAGQQDPAEPRTEDEKDDVFENPPDASSPADEFQVVEKKKSKKKAAQQDTPEPQAQMQKDDVVAKEPNASGWARESQVADNKKADKKKQGKAGWFDENHDNTQDQKASSAAKAKRDRTQDIWDNDDAGFVPLGESTWGAEPEASARKKSKGKAAAMLPGADEIEPVSPTSVGSPDRWGASDKKKNVHDKGALKDHFESPSKSHDRSPSKGHDKSPSKDHAKGPSKDYAKGDSKDHATDASKDKKSQHWCLTEKGFSKVHDVKIETQPQRRPAAPAKQEIPRRSEDRHAKSRPPAVDGPYMTNYGWVRPAPPSKPPPAPAKQESPRRSEDNHARSKPPLITRPYITSYGWVRPARPSKPDPETSAKGRVPNLNSWKTRFLGVSSKDYQAWLDRIESPPGRDAGPELSPIRDRPSNRSKAPVDDPGRMSAKQIEEKKQELRRQWKKLDELSPGKSRKDNVYPHESASQTAPMSSSSSDNRDSPRQKREVTSHDHAHRPAHSHHRHHTVTPGGSPIKDSRPRDSSKQFMSGALDSQSSPSRDTQGTRATEPKSYYYDDIKPLKCAPFLSIFQRSPKGPKRDLVMVRPARNSPASTPPRASHQSDGRAYGSPATGRSYRPHEAAGNYWDDGSPRARSGPSTPSSSRRTNSSRPHQAAPLDAIAEDREATKSRGRTAEKVSSKESKGSKKSQGWENDSKGNMPGGW